MTVAFSLSIAQLNPVVGDLRGNLDKLAEVRQEVTRRGSDLLVVSELYVSGYPLEDLVLKRSFQEVLEGMVRGFVGSLGEGTSILMGAPWREDGVLYNSVLLLERGVVRVVQRKRELPNYGVFDEKRWFTSGESLRPFIFRGVSLGILVCEDMWGTGMAYDLFCGGAEFLIVLNSSPFEEDKQRLRLEKARACTQKTGLPLVYVNQVGGQDELVFDGSSFVLDGRGEVCFQGYAFRSDLQTIQCTKVREGWCIPKVRQECVPLRLSGLYQGMVLALRDYVEKNGFVGIVMGLSGGIDSALSAVVGVDALGCERVDLLMMPSPYTSHQSIEDAEFVVERLGCRAFTLPIKDMMDSFGGVLYPYVQSSVAGVTYENIQARIRGVLLMAWSNTFGHMVVATGNKSEMSVGYATLYGDMCGGYAILKDVYKTTVYDLVRWRNRERPWCSLGPEGVIVPDSILTKAPTAELKPEQCDQDSLPPYEQLDDILMCLIEQDLDIQTTASRGHDLETVKYVAHLVARAEYKRRQSPPGVKLSSRSLGRERRYPLVNAFKF